MTKDLKSIRLAYPMSLPSSGGWVGGVLLLATTPDNIEALRGRVSLNQQTLNKHQFKGLDCMIYIF